MNRWGPISAALHVASIVAIVLLFTQYHFVDPELYAAAKANPGSDALSLASQLGRLDVVSLILTLAGLFLAFLGIFGFVAVRREAIAESKDAAEEVIPEEVKKYMDMKASALIRACLSDAEIASSLHAEILKLGIRDAYMAYDVDTDAELKETPNGR
ncbi:hypothetical protein [Mesorhizobium sp.]|uniref:hypothetical protein n=1 Tax=Mesorhizobium sp. TaxID=1871066 RepID=UPI000FE6867B|nr:hypothetical protein [Mesorhizobium sp.]RWA67484.1 MAG: hypothetical protein EOQ29_23570 [Mesorhizobium sp.]RWA78718.1 MAG: hypothetical protein EOQ30_28300 [Mesorhizobium sp.]